MFIKQLFTPHVIGHGVGRLEELVAGHAVQLVRHVQRLFRLLSTVAASLDPLRLHPRRVLVLARALQPRLPLLLPPAK